MLTIGIDPDLHDLAIGVWKDGRPAAAKVLHVPHRKGVIQHEAVLAIVQQMDEGMFIFDGEYPVTDAVAIEAQTLARRGPRTHKRPQDIVILGNVAGAALCVSRFCLSGELLFPTPEEWKGQIPKEVMQARLYEELSWGYEQLEGYSRPLHPPAVFSNITPGQWKHVGDALLLARWAEQQCQRTAPAAAPTKRPLASKCSPDSRSHSEKQPKSVRSTKTFASRTAPRIRRGSAFGR